MRWYDLTLRKQGAATIWQPTPTGDGFTQASTGSTFASYVTGPNGSGVNLSGALNIEFDCVVTPWDSTQGAMKVLVWGVGLKMLSQAANLTGSSFVLQAGMKPGLPLATASYNAGQGGLIASGIVLQSYGQWQGVNQWLELICYPSVAQPTTSNIDFTWKVGQSLSAALATTLSAAFAGQGFTTINTSNISATLVPPNDQRHTVTTLQAFASWLAQYTSALGQPTYGGAYSGVRIYTNGNAMIAADGQGAVGGKQFSLAFQDLIGQPTWLTSVEIGFKTVLRADITVGNTVTLPQGLQSPYLLTTPGVAYPNTPAAATLTFAGPYLITEVHHFANFRQPDGDSWATAYKAVPQNFFGVQGSGNTLVNQTYYGNGGT